MGNFKPWVDVVSAGTNVQSASDFATDTQRSSGFVVGSVSSAIRVNSGLRQANLVATALMELVAPDSNLSLVSSVSDVSDAIESYFDGYASSSDLTSLDTRLTASINTVSGSVTTLRNDVYHLITGTLNAGSTSITLTDNTISSNKALSFYTSIYGVNPQSASVSNHSVTLTFEAQSSNMKVGVKVDGTFSS